MVTEQYITMDEMYKKELAEMQKSNHQLMVRIKELNEENNRLRQKLNEKK
jgi:prefoldin subunit 5